MVGFDGFEEASMSPSTSGKLGTRCCGRKQKNGGISRTAFKPGRCSKAGIAVPSDPVEAGWLTDQIFFMTQQLCLRTRAWGEGRSLEGDTRPSPTGTPGDRSLPFDCDISCQSFPWLDRPGTSRRRAAKIEVLHCSEVSFYLPRLNEPTYNIHSTLQ